MNRKGFFFIIMSFVLLAYILTSTYFWVRAIEMEESRYSDSFRISTMEMLLDQVTPATVNHFTNISARYSFYRLNHHSIANPIRLNGHLGDGYEVEVKNVGLAMRDLIIDGEASKDYFNGDALIYSDSDKLTYTLSGWKNQLNASLAASNFELVSLDIDKDSFAFTQTNFTVFNVSFVMGLTIKDLQPGSETSIVRSYNVSLPVDVTGMVDPYIARQSRELDLTLDDGTKVLVGKKVFMAPEEEYPDKFESLCSEHAESGQCYKVGEADEGQGWFYGPMVNTEDALTQGIAGDVNLSQNYILVGTYSEIVALTDFESFGAYVLTNKPIETAVPSCPGKSSQTETFNPITYDSSCDAVIDDSDITAITTKPFIVEQGFDISDFNGVNLPGLEDAHKMLFIATPTPKEVLDDPRSNPKNEYVAMYDIEMFRDFVMCGYYLPRNNSPTYLHRMMDIQPMFDSNNPAYDNWPEYSWGIETTAVGRWAGGNIVPDADVWDKYSRVDIEFFSKVSDGSSNPVQMIKGMPGCKSAIMSSMELGYTPNLHHVGHFRLSDWAQWDREAGYNDIYWIELENGDEGNIGCDNEDVAGCDINE